MSDTRGGRARSTVPALIIASCAVMTLRLALTGTYRQYVRNSMGVWLVIAGVVLGAASLLLVAVARRHEGDSHAPTHDHDHDHTHVASRVGWLLLVPVVAVLVIAPKSLGTFAFDRALAPTVQSSGSGSFADLPAGTEPLPMSMAEFDQRAFDRDGASFGDREVRLVGFVVHATATEFTVARFQIACCAADAKPHVARTALAGRSFARDEWIEVTGRYERGSAASGTPTLVDASARTIAAPGDPYEDG